MKTLALLSQKGGSGKIDPRRPSGCHRAGRGRRTVVVDLDPQRSAAGWWDTRAAETPELVETTPGELRAVLDAARADRVALCVLDTRPSAGADAATAAALADLVLIPTRPAIFDLKAIGATVDIVAAAKVPAFIVLNGTPPARGSARPPPRPMQGAPWPTIAFPSRRVHRPAGGAGARPGGRPRRHEFDPAGKAALEMMKLWQFTEEHLWPNDPRSAR